MVSGPPKESVQGENALYIFNRLLRMATETDLSTWKQNQVRNFMKHDQIDEILTLTDGFGRTILDNACSAGNLRLVQLLWPMGAKLGKPHITMSIVASEEFLSILDYLLSHDPSLSTTDVVVGEEDDETERMPLLNFCAKKGDERVIGVLLAYAFKTPESISESLDHAGNTPIHFVRKEKVAAQILNRSGLEILRKANRRGQLPIDCLLERYSAMPSSNGFGNGALAGFEVELKRTITFLNTLMNHAPSKGPTSRTVTPPTLPLNNLGGSLGAGTESTIQLPSTPSILGRRGSGASASPRSSMCLPPREVPKSFLSRGLISDAVARNRAALMQEQRELLKSEVAASMRRQRMLDLQQQDPLEQQLALKGSNPYATVMAQQQQLAPPPSSPSSSSTIRLPLTSNSRTPSSPILNQNNNKGYVAAIDAAFASENNNSSGVSPSLSLLASALSNHHKTQTAQKNGLMLANGLSSAEDYRLRAATGKSLYPSRYQDSELHKLLRAKYC